MTCNRWAHCEIAKCLGCPLKRVEMSLKTLPGYLLAVLSPFSQQQDNSVLGERKTTEKIFRKAFRGENLKQHTFCTKKIFLNIYYYLLLDSLCNCLYIFMDCHMDFVENYRK